MSPTSIFFLDSYTTDGINSDLSFLKKVTFLFILSAINELLVPKSMPTENCFFLLGEESGSDI